MLRWTRCCYSYFKYACNYAPKQSYYYFFFILQDSKYFQNIEWNLSSLYRYCKILCICLVKKKQESRIFYMMHGTWFECFSPKFHQSSNYCFHRFIPVCLLRCGICNLHDHFFSSVMWAQSPVCSLCVTSSLFHEVIVCSWFVEFLQVKLLMELFELWGFKAFNFMNSICHVSFHEYFIFFF